MEFRKFVEEVKAEAERLCAGEYEIKIQEVPKNNGRTHTGMTFTKKGEAGRAVGVTVYPETYYDMFMAGAVSVSRAAEGILGMVESNGEQKAAALSYAADLADFEKVKGKVVYRLVDYKSNRELLKKVPFIAYCDLAIVFDIYLGEQKDGCLTARIYNNHMKMWKTDVDTLYGLAKENTFRILPPAIKAVSDVIKEIAESYAGSGGDKDLVRMMSESREMLPLYILTNRSGINGASVILYDGVLRDFAGRLGSDLLILPSSIHEVLVLSYKEDMDAVELGEMVKYINRTEVPPEDVLSESVYRYGREEDRVELISGNGSVSRAGKVNPVSRRGFLMPDLCI